MKTRLVLALVLIACAFSYQSCKEECDGFKIEGTISNCNNCKISLEQLSPMKVTELKTTSVDSDGKFELCHNDSIKRLYRLKVDNKPPIHLCLSNEDNISIEIDCNDIENYKITGSKDCSELKALNMRMLESTRKIEELRNRVSRQDKITAENLEENNKIASELYASDKQFIIDFIKRNHTSPIIYLALHQYVSTTPIMQLPADYETYKYVLAEMKQHNPDLSETVFLESEVTRFELQEEQRNRDYVNLSKDSPAPSFTLNDIDGKKTTLSDFAGKKISVCFWASWDKKSVKAIQEYISNNKDRQIVLISLDVDKEQWKQAIKFYKLEEAVNLCDFKTWESINTKMYGVTSIPAIIEISEEQKIVEIHRF